MCVTKTIHDFDTGSCFSLETSSRLNYWIAFWVKCTQALNKTYKRIVKLKNAKKSSQEKFLASLRSNGSRSQLLKHTDTRKVCRKKYVSCRETHCIVLRCPKELFLRLHSLYSQLVLSLRNFSAVKI